MKKAKKKIVKKRGSKVASRPLLSSSTKTASKPKSDSGVIRLRVPEDLSKETLEMLKQKARENNVTLNDFIDQAVMEHIQTLKNKQLIDGGCCGGSCGCSEK